MQTTFGIKPGARVETIIDGAYLYSVCRTLNFDINFEALRTILQAEYDSRRISYLVKVLYDDDGEIVQASIAKLLDYLRYNGYRTVLGEAREWTDSSGRRNVARSIDAAMTLAMLQAASKVDELIIVTNNDDLVPVCEECARMGARITLLATMRMPLPMGLRSVVDWFVDIGDIKDKILRRERDPMPNVAPSRETIREDAAVVIEDRRGQEGVRPRTRRVTA